MDTFELEWKEPFDVRDLTCYVDTRGMLFEILRFKDARIPGQGQLYTFSIEPHQRRGDHYHLNKREWFTCVHGEAIVLLSNSKGGKRAVTISPKNPKIVYAGPGTAHALINEHKEVAVIVSYGSEQHDPVHEDTYRHVAFEGYDVAEEQKRLR
ncbi:MAG: WxcM-like domain-containing protein [Phycisphaerae bacterium]|jgi:UDP-2-acetamido-2,6-beta-L-arabino-hexul-4-ose reductase|nr:WxcM-like domain-containing protein [Phycisphaerae bacterium]